MCILKTLGTWWILDTVAKVLKKLSSFLREFKIDPPYRKDILPDVSRDEKHRQQVNTTPPRRTSILLAEIYKVIVS